jgi:hypothetical protein
LSCTDCGVDALAQVVVAGEGGIYFFGVGAGHGWVFHKGMVRDVNCCVVDAMGTFGVAEVCLVARGPVIGWGLGLV